MTLVRLPSYLHMKGNGISSQRRLTSKPSKQTTTPLIFDSLLLAATNALFITSAFMAGKFNHGTTAQVASKVFKRWFRGLGISQILLSVLTTTTSYETGDRFGGHMLVATTSLTFANVATFPTLNLNPGIDFIGMILNAINFGTYVGNVQHRLNSTTPKKRQDVYGALLASHVLQNLVWWYFTKNATQFAENEVNGIENSCLRDCRRWFISRGERGVSEATLLAAAERPIDDGVLEEIRQKAPTGYRRRPSSPEVATGGEAEALLPTGLTPRPSSPELATGGEAEALLPTGSKRTQSSPEVATEGGAQALLATGLKRTQSFPGVATGGEAKDVLSLRRTTSLSKLMDPPSVLNRAGSL